MRNHEDYFEVDFITIMNNKKNIIVEVTLKEVK